MTSSKTKRLRTSFERDPQYWQALGEFIEAFAAAEIVVIHYLGFCAEVPVGIERAIFSGVHAEAAAGLIRRIWDVRAPAPEVRRELEDVLEQLTAINKIRNSVVHYASFVTDDKGRVSSNIAKAHIPERITEHRVSAALLRDMASDLLKAANHLVMLRIWPSSTFEERAKEIPVLGHAWLYTRPQGNQNRSKKSDLKAKSKRPVPVGRR